MLIKSYTLNKALQHILILSFEIPYSLPICMPRYLSFDRVVNCSPYRREEVCTYYINHIRVSTYKIHKYKYLLKHISLYAEKHGYLTFKDSYAQNQ